MADSNVDQGSGKDNQGPTPAIDMEQFRGVIEETLAKHLEARHEPLPDEDRQPLPQPQPQPQAENPLAEVIAPIVNPHLRKLGVEAASARDAAIFYATHPEAIKYKDDIERGWEAMAKAGVYLTREAIFNHWKGQNIDKVLEDRAKAAQEAERAARERAGVGEGVPEPGKGVKIPAGDPVTWSDEDLDKFLKTGVQGQAIVF